MQVFFSKKIKFSKNGIFYSMKGYKLGAAVKILNLWRMLFVEKIRLLR